MSRPTHPSGSDARDAPRQGGRREVMTLVFTDLVGSTRLKEELGNDEALRLIREHHSLVRTLLREFPAGHEISTAGDSFFLAFLRPSDAVAFALRLQSRLRNWNRHHPRKVLDRVGIHAGEVTVEEGPDGRIHDLHGLEVDKCARVMSLGRENHILLTRFAFDNARASLKGQSLPEVADVRWVKHGLYELKGVAEPLEICEAAEAGWTALEPPADSEKARRVPGALPAEDEATPPAGGRRWLAGRRISRRLAWAGAAASALAGVLAFSFVGPLTDLSYDLAYLFRRPETPPEALIVRMDPESERELVQPPDRHWDRSLHARLIDRMRQLGARAVVMDVWFDGTTEPANDAALVAAARAFPRLVVAGRVITDVRLGVFAQETVQGPFPALEAATRWGLSFFPHGLDQVVRRPHPGREGQEHLALEAARLLGAPVPADPRRTWLNYYGPPGTFDWVSYSQALNGPDSDRRFTNRIVFVGAVNLHKTGFTGGWLNDEGATPYTRWSGRPSPGVEIVATTTVNLLRGEWLRRLPVGVELLGILLAGLAAGYGLGRLRPLPALVAASGAGLLVGVAASLAVWPTRVWCPWLVVSAVQLPVALAWAVIAWANGPPRPSAATQTARPPSNGGAARPMAGEISNPASTAAAPGPGRCRVTLPDYELLAEIGRGAYGQVWLVRDAVGLLRAAKIVQRSAFANARPFDREFEGIKRFTPISLEHPGLVRILHVGRDEAAGFFYYVMEAADDGTTGANLPAVGYAPRTLAGDLKRRGRLPPAEVVTLGIALVEAVEFLHSHQLVHRDIKPANILFVHGRPKLADIGLVTAMAGTDGSVTCLGTPGYIPPEGPGQAPADVFSLGKVLYVAATGCDPQAFPTLPEDIDRWPDRHILLALNDVWLRACEPDADRRLRSAAEIGARLLALPPAGRTSTEGSGPKPPE